mmetsp:Transcript_29699/g.49219  ORF Transcript_29699/g.49219 Transcript_29699/m.49219 type:complete len:221 (-) Transcript_29699:472-1134(-)
MPCRAGTTVLIASVVMWFVLYKLFIVLGSNSRNNLVPKWSFGFSGCGQLLLHLRLFMTRVIVWMVRVLSGCHGNGGSIIFHVVVVFPLFCAMTPAMFGRFRGQIAVSELEGVRRKHTSVFVVLLSGCIPKLLSLLLPFFLACRPVCRPVCCPVCGPASVANAGRDGNGLQRRLVFATMSPGRRLELQMLQKMGDIRSTTSIIRVENNVVVVVVVQEDVLL